MTDPVTVLVVNQGPILSPALNEFLWDQGEVVVIGRVGGDEDPLESVRALRPQVILVDLPGPGLTGLATISRLREARAEGRIIALAAPEIQRYREVVLGAGADELISKDSLSTDLLSTIRGAT